MKIIIASDSFKGSLSSAEVGEAARSGVLDSYPDADVTVMTMADGGEGTTDALIGALGGTRHTATVPDPLRRPVEASYGIAGDTAILDMASASGLTLLTDSERNPMLTSTYGTGCLIADAWNRGCRRFVVGIGGSATNDGGMGMLEALGVRFLDSEGHELPGCGASLGKVAAIDLTGARHDILTAPFTVICDVSNPLYGPTGAAHVFAPQKGADAAMVEMLDSGMRRYAAAVASATGRDVATTPGAGAAGGLGAAFLAFFNAELCPGIDTVLRLTGFDSAVTDADLVITGEGRIDSQTLYGKVPLGVLCSATRAGVPVVAIGGCVEDVLTLSREGFAGVFATTPRPMTLAEAMRTDAASDNVRAVVSQIVKLFNSKNP